MLFFSCYYDELPEVIPEELPEGTVVSFEDDITPIFVTYNCTQCHNSSGTNPDLTPGNEYTSLVPNYVKAGNSSESKLYTKLAFEKHRNVDSKSLAQIKKWIDDGAENN